MSEKEYHFIGIGGIGMSALANILLERNIKVSGSDISDNTMVKKLMKRGASVFLGQSGKNITSQKKVVYSTDIKEENPEMQAAKDLNCPILHRSELLNELMQGYTTLGVTGTHGKTTVTSLLISILNQEKLDPSYAIGGLFEGENGHHGKGKYFVAEADESDGTFLKYHPFGAIVTNVEPEHMNYYKTEESLYSAFETFFSSVKSAKNLFYWGDDPYLSKLAKGKGFSYGFGKDCDLRLSNYRQKGWKIFFDIEFQGRKYGDIEAALIGKMHALNASAAFGLCLSLGISEEAIRSALRSFGGVKRRLEKKGEISKVLFLDDYAHHPTEVKKTLMALKEAVPERRLIVLFQPHRYSRLKDLMDDFATSFESADKVFVTETYAASEKAMPGVTSEKLVERIQKKGTVPVEFLSRDKYVEHLKTFLRPHDVVITMGAGDITNFSAPVLEILEKTPPKKYVLGLIFGGRSAEHEISLRSTRFVYESLNKDIYDVKLFGIDKKGYWVKDEEALFCLKEKTVVESEKALPLLSQDIVEALSGCEIFFPVLHGPNGEDGTIQGFFEMMAKPYAGPDFRSCAITMDKVLTKKVLLSSGVPTSKFLNFSYVEWLRDKEKILEEIESHLHFPLFIKPSRLGSSVGINRVDDKEALEEAILYAFRFDELILVEEGVLEARELEFAVMGNYKGYIDVPHPGEKLADGNVVDYEMKYGQNPVKADLNPSLEEKDLNKGKELAEKAYLAVGITGMSRVDCLLDKKGNFFFFEINAIPGLQKLSLFPKIWARDGVPGPELVDRMILLGLLRRRNQERHEHTCHQFLS